MKNFFFAPLSPAIFGWFRIATGLLALWLCATLFPGLYLVYGQHGLVIWEVADSLVSPMQPTMGRLYNLLGGAIGPDTLLYTFFGMYVVVLLLFTLGWKTRLMAILAWLMHLTLMNTCRFGSYGVESMLHLALFYAIFFPCGATFSMDSRGKMPAPPDGYARLCLRVLQFQMCIVYLSAGFEKCFGAEWWDGNAIWYSLNEEQFRQFDFSWLAQAPWIAKLMGWWTLLIECGYAFAIWIPRLRRFWLANTILLHLGIGLFMGLHAFAAMMIILNLSAFALAAYPTATATLLSIRWPAGWSPSFSTDSTPILKN